MVLSKEKVIIWVGKFEPITIIQNPFIFSKNFQMNRNEGKLEFSKMRSRFIQPIKIIARFSIRYYFTILNLSYTIK